VPPAMPARMMAYHCTARAGESSPSCASEVDGVFDRDDVVGLIVVNLVNDCGQRGRFSRARRAGDQHNSVPQIRDFHQLRWQVEAREGRHTSRDHAHDNRAAPALRENVDAKPSQLCQAVGDVARALLAKFVHRQCVAANQVARNPRGVFRSQRTHLRNRHLFELSARFHLRGASRRKNKIADMLGRPQHGGDDCRRGERVLVCFRGLSVVHFQSIPYGDLGLIGRNIKCGLSRGLLQ